MICIDKTLFLLETQRTTYCFCVTEQGLLQHLYYGRRLALSGGWEALVPQVRHLPGNAAGWGTVCLEDRSLEISAPGLGDLRETMLDVEDGTPADFRFDHAEILTEKPALEGLPSSYDEAGECRTLRVRLTDRNNALRLELLYTVFEDCDVITRSARLVNLGKKPVTVNRLLSNQVDFPEQDYILTTFTGAWGREFERTEFPCGPGAVVSGSRTGCSSNRANPFVMLRRTGADEVHGDCFGFHLLYSGDHFECADGNAYGQLRLLQGIQPEGFSWHLEPGEAFTAPEAAMTHGWGLTAMSENLHAFLREHVVRGLWKHRPRPVLVNSWESFYFRFTQRDLLRLARQGRDLGAELFVLDDGWFGKRDNDRCSLGDWDITNKKKLPDGLKGLADRVRELGIGFGLWVEPEMVSEDSALYRAHPDWILGRPGQAMGRNQYLLDLGRREVQDHLIRVLSKVFAEAGPAYVKWDMNRIMTDARSGVLPPERQGEARHRYILGLYRVLGTLTERFPRILFEGCASGGNRTDPGMLCYMPQVWLSDNTDALCRCRIQYGASFGYPQSVMGCHVSASPNHQTLRTTPLDSRFHVSAFGLLGYELDLCGLPDSEKTRVAGQLAFYKKYRDVLQYGRLYRLRGGEEGLWQLMAVSGDRGTALTFLLQQENRPNAPSLRLLARGLSPKRTYRLSVRPAAAALTDFGSLVNMVSPVHIRPGSLAEKAAGAVRLPGEREDLTASGDLLMKYGAWLKQGFSGTGYDGQTRVMGDCGSRLYVLEGQRAISPARPGRPGAARDTGRR